MYEPSWAHFSSVELDEELFDTSWVNDCSGVLCVFGVCEASYDWGL